MGAKVRFFLGGKIGFDCCLVTGAGEENDKGDGFGAPNVTACL